MKSDIMTFHLIYPVKENEPSEEVVFAIQGIIYRQDLPPFDKQIPYVNSHFILISGCNYHFV